MLWLSGSNDIYVWLAGGSGGPVLQTWTGPAAATGNSRVADLNGDGNQDIITAPGPGTATQVKLFDGLTLAELAGLFPFGPLFPLGVTVGGT